MGTELPAAFAAWWQVMREKLRVEAWDHALREFCMAIVILRVNEETGFVLDPEAFDEGVTFDALRERFFENVKDTVTDAMTAMSSLQNITIKVSIESPEVSILAYDDFFPDIPPFEDVDGLRVWIINLLQFAKAMKRRLEIDIQEIRADRCGPQTDAMHILTHYARILENSVAQINA